MAGLSDGTIARFIEEGRIGIEPFDRALLQPASIDVRLGNTFRVFHNHRVSVIDLRNVPACITEEVRLENDDDAFVIHPGEFCLGSTLEWVRIPADILCRIDGKSSLGRLGLIVHATAGFIDPGYQGTVTLELANLSRVPIRVYRGIPIAQLSFAFLDAEVERPYGHPDLGSHYQGQSIATESRYGRAADIETLAAQPVIVVGNLTENQR
ncbi:MAG TPA: dCTP deaminase [Candidatus Baltobacteraceae bacterium]|jgi:dCTP deaminase|nr:dCTP deaminase [Candidatus Baltobacteraceae bacterium]